MSNSSAKAPAGFAARLLSAAGVDAAVAYSLAGRAWQGGAAFISLLILAQTLEPAEKGVYFTFSSILALQVFFELGFTLVLVQFVSHERARLQWDGRALLSGDAIAQDRFSSLVQLATRWYGRAAAGLIALVVPAGFWLFGARSAELAGVAWAAPWCLVVVAAASGLALSPFFTILEGLGAVAEVARFRLWQEMACGCLLWLALTAGLGLYAAAVYQFARCTLGASWLFLRYRALLSSALRRQVNQPISWSREIWPLQWKISLSWMAGYFASQLFNPVIFAYSGPVVAGQFGMSLALATGLSNAVLAWISTKAPTFGVLVSRRDFAALDQLFFRSLSFCLLFALGGFLVVISAMEILERSGHPFRSQLVGRTDFLLLCGAMVGNLVVTALATYLRAHKAEPFLLLSCVHGVATGLCTLLVGRWFGLTGILAAYFATTSVVAVGWGTFIFLQKRKLWHQATPAPCN